MTDETTLPESPSPETLRAVVVYMQRDIRKLQRDLEENDRLDDEDRQLVARISERTDQILTRMDKSPLVQLGDFFARLFGLGDNARRPWVWIVLLLLFVLGGLVWYARDTYADPDIRAERIEDTRRRARADSIREARAHELEVLRLRREIAGDQADEAEARAETPGTARIDELDVEAGAVTVTPSEDTPSEGMPSDRP